MEFENVKELIKIFDDSSLSRLKFNQDGASITLEKGSAKEEIIYAEPQVISEPKEAISKVITEKNELKSGDYIKSPMVGSFYSAPNPGADVFAKAGDRVSKGQTLCILEAMKIMNEIEAEFDCKILEVLVEDGQAIEYDMPLFSIERI